MLNQMLAKFVKFFTNKFKRGSVAGKETGSQKLQTQNIVDIVSLLTYR